MLLRNDDLMFLCLSVASSALDLWIRISFENKGIIIPHKTSERRILLIPRIEPLRGRISSLFLSTIQR